ncbi:MAG: site-specific DNA-methyltransferase [Acidobacteria bacterium]|nr:site-specific DNA-methyltransferase [Acidobacteriota bacterium]
MAVSQPPLFTDFPTHEGVSDPESFEHHLRQFHWDGKPTLVSATTVEFDHRSIAVKTFVNEFWTSRQRAAHSLHEVSYRACFKPQLPKFFIDRLTRLGDTVYDPFMGRGTTLLEAALLGRVAVGCDINPLSKVLVEPRLQPPLVEAVRQRLEDVNWTANEEFPDDLLTFYDPDTLREICALKAYLRRRVEAGSLDAVDAWIRMVAVNRLTGHSPGFFSVYTLPPNQAVSVIAQKKINADRDQAPPRRSVPKLIVAKSRSLLRDYDESTRLLLDSVAGRHRLLTAPAATTPHIESSTVNLVVTSPPFLDVVNYAGDNWLRCWFCGVNPADVKLTILKKIEDWRDAMTSVFIELNRVLAHGGHVAFEVGEVRGGRVRLEEHVIPCGVHAGLEPVLVLINAQEFTKTAACWGVDNNLKGTNTNRIVLFRKL